MTLDPVPQARLDQNFLDEASDLLQTIEQTLLNLLEEKTTEKVHALMRSAHTLKGSAASVGQKTIQTIAHHLEDVFQALYSPELEIDPELGSLLLDGYECLRTPLSATLSGSSYNEAAILDRTASVFAQLQAKLGDFFGREAPLPTSEELGFDVVGSIFVESVSQDLQQLEAALASQDPQQVQTVFRSQAEFFAELGASYSLPGLEEIARATLAALEQHPTQSLEIGRVALENFLQARADVIEGDRDRGGKVSPQLSNLAGLATPVEASLPEAVTAPLEAVPPLEAEVDPPAVAISTENENSQVSPTSDSETQLSSLFSQKSENLVSIPEVLGSLNGDVQAAISPIDRILQSLWTGDPETVFRSSPPSQARATGSAPEPPPSSHLQSTAASPSIRVAIEQLNRLSHTVGELLINENQQNLQTDQIQRAIREAFEQFLHCQQKLAQVRDWSDKHLLLRDRQQRCNRAIPKNSLASERPHLTAGLPLTSSALPASEGHFKFDVLEMDVYSDLHLLLQSLTENMMQLGDQIEALEGITHQSRFNLGKRKQLLSGAQEDLLQARMVPLATVFNRFPRLLQQMVAAHHKPAELKLSGIQVLVDKTISEKLYDPLLHLIRNAYDHGIESADIRRQQGKPETGQISIQAYHQGNRTTIEVRDDGQGLNWERIRQKAINNRLLSPAEAASASQAQLAEVLFEPGFSTAEEVGELSGRGVGLDVVRSQLQALQGIISVQSVPGQGTAFSLQLPLSLTTARLLVCQSQGNIYALLAETIDQVLLPQPDQIQTQQSLTGQGMQAFLRWEEESSQQLVPIRSLADLLSYRYPLFSQNKSSSLSPFPIEQRNAIEPLLMLQTKCQRLCLQVERILVEQELVIKSLSSKLALPGYIQGYSVLGDGSLALVIDPAGLVAQAWAATPIANFSLPRLPIQRSAGSGSSGLALLASREERPELTPPQEPQVLGAEPTNNYPEPTAQRATVLVIEDSVVQRQSLVLTLQKDGYQVLQAENGQEAIAQLNQNSEVHLIISDVEMPRMNGFEFLSHCRQHPRFSQIPIAMLTTRSSEKHRQLASALGARAYFTKPYSDQGLLKAVAQLIVAPIVNRSQSFVSASFEETCSL